MDFLRQIHLDTKRIFFPFGVAAPFSIYQMIATTTCTTCKGKKKGFSFLLLFLLLRRKWLAVCDAQVFFLCVQLCVGWGCCHLGWASRFVFGIDVKTMQKGRSILSLGCGQGCQCVASRKENRREETIDWSLMRQPRLNQDDNNQKKKRHCSLQRSKVLLDLFLLLSISFSFFLSRQLPLSTEKKIIIIFSFPNFFYFLFFYVLFLPVFFFLIPTVVMICRHEKNSVMSLFNLLLSIKTSLFNQASHVFFLSSWSSRRQNLLKKGKLFQRQNKGEEKENS